MGYITPDVYALRDQFYLSGMRVLQFGFDGQSENPHLPHNYTANTVVYTGTHDNPPSRAWYEELPADRREDLWRCLRLAPADRHDVTWELIRSAWSSVAALAIAPLQDLLNLGVEARMNIPGAADGNWAWRATETMFADTVFQALSDLTLESNRRGALDSPSFDLSGSNANSQQTLQNCV